MDHEQAESRDKVVQASGDVFVTRDVLVRAVRVDKRECDFVFSSEAKDSYGEIVKQNWRLDRFARNPVILFAHQSRALPIGRGKDVAVRDGCLGGTVVFASEKANPVAEQVWQSVQERTLCAGSVGFIPHTIRYEMIDDVEVCVLDDNELLEFSITPVPANPEALAKMKAKALEDFRERNGVWRIERSVVPYKPESPVDHGAWDASAAEGRIRKWASSDGSGDKDKMDWAKYRRGFAWYDAENAEHFGSYKLPHHDVDGGTLDTIKSGVIAAGDAIMGSRGGVKIPEADVDGVKAHLAKHYRQFDMTPPWEEKKSNVPATTKTSSAERGPKQETNQMDEKEKAALELKIATHEKTIRDTEKALLDEKTKTIALTDQNATLVKERDIATARALAAEGTLIERDVDALIGKKFAPSERAKQIELAKKDPELWKELTAQRSEMAHTTQVIPEVDKGAPPVPATSGGDSLDDLNAKALQAAHAN